MARFLWCFLVLALSPIDLSSIATPQTSFLHASAFPVAVPFNATTTYDAAEIPRSISDTLDSIQLDIAAYYDTHQDWPACAQFHLYPDEIIVDNSQVDEMRSHTEERTYTAEVQQQLPLLLSTSPGIIVHLAGHPTNSLSPDSVPVPSSVRHTPKAHTVIPPSPPGQTRRPVIIGQGAKHITLAGSLHYLPPHQPSPSPSPSSSFSPSSASSKNTTNPARAVSHHPLAFKVAVVGASYHPLRGGVFLKGTTTQLHASITLQDLEGSVPHFLRTTKSIYKNIGVCKVDGVPFYVSERLSCSQCKDTYLASLNMAERLMLAVQYSCIFAEFHAQPDPFLQGDAYCEQFCLTTTSSSSSSSSSSALSRAPSLDAIQAWLQSKQPRFTSTGSSSSSSSSSSPPSFFSPSAAASSSLFETHLQRVFDYPPLHTPFSYRAIGAVKLVDSDDVSLRSHSLTYGGNGGAPEYWSWDHTSFSSSSNAAARPSLPPWAMPFVTLETILKRKNELTAVLEGRKGSVEGGGKRDNNETNDVGKEGSESKARTTQGDVYILSQFLTAILVDTNADLFWDQLNPPSSSSSSSFSSSSTSVLLTPAYTYIPPSPSLFLSPLSRRVTLDTPAPTATPPPTTFIITPAPSTTPTPYTTLIPTTTNNTTTTNSKPPSRVNIDPVLRPDGSVDGCALATITHFPSTAFPSFVQLREPFLSVFVQMNRLQLEEQLHQQGEGNGGAEEGGENKGGAFVSPLLAHQLISPPLYLCDLNREMQNFFRKHREPGRLGSLRPQFPISRQFSYVDPNVVESGQMNKLYPSPLTFATSPLPPSPAAFSSSSFHPRFNFSENEEKQAAALIGHNESRILQAWVGPQSMSHYSSQEQLHDATARGGRERGEKEEGAEEKGGGEQQEGLSLFRFSPRDYLCPLDKFAFTRFALSLSTPVSDALVREPLKKGYIQCTESHMRWKSNMSVEYGQRPRIIPKCLSASAWKRLLRGGLLLLQNSQQRQQQAGREKEEEKEHAGVGVGEKERKQRRQRNDEEKEDLQTIWQLLIGVLDTVKFGCSLHPAHRPSAKYLSLVLSNACLQLVCFSLLFVVACSLLFHFVDFSIYSPLIQLPRFSSSFFLLLNVCVSHTS